MSSYYFVRSPESGRWACAPNRGVCGDIGGAYPYTESHPHLRFMVKLSRRHGYRLKLRQVPEEDALLMLFEHEQEHQRPAEFLPADPEPSRVECPECRGTGDSPNMPAFDCFVCDGAGWVDA